MTTEGKITEIIKQAIEDIQIGRTWRGDPEEVAIKELHTLFASKIREEKIKALEEIMASEQKVAVAIAIALLKLRSEGKEKGKV